MSPICFLLSEKLRQRLRQLGRLAWETKPNNSQIEWAMPTETVPVLVCSGHYRNDTCLPKNERLPEQKC